MITRQRMSITRALRFSWKNLLYGFIVSLISYLIHFEFGVQHVSIPPSVAAIPGGALAILLAFRNASAYERW